MHTLQGKGDCKWAHMWSVEPYSLFNSLPLGSIATLKANTVDDILIVGNDMKAISQTNSWLKS